MKITKFAHACLLVEESGVAVLVDPGSWNSTPQVDALDAILITHEHQDHFALDQIQELLAKHLQAVIITHEAVGKLLDEAGISHTSIEEKEVVEVKGVTIESFGHAHAVMHSSVEPCRNTGFLIAGKLFIPGDALHDFPGKPIEVLALPTGGPWMKMSEAIDYARAVAPKFAFPIHDAMHTEDYRRGFLPKMLEGYLQPVGIEFRDMADGAVEGF